MKLGWNYFQPDPSRWTVPLKKSTNWCRLSSSCSARKQIQSQASKYMNDVCLIERKKRVDRYGASVCAADALSSRAKTTGYMWYQRGLIIKRPTIVFFWVPQNLSHHISRLGRTGHIIRTQTLPWWLGGKKVKKDDRKQNTLAPFVWYSLTS